MKLNLHTLAAAAILISVPFGVLAQGGPPNAPFAGGAKKVSCDQALKEAPKDDPSLVPLDKAYNAADAKLKKSPKDAKLKKAYEDAAYKYAHEVTYGQSKLSPAVKYRAGLALYRKVVAVDPKNAAAVKEKKQIEDIYGQMGMPIPK